MISIVICSVKEDEFSKVSENIKRSIGVHFEIIRVDNSNRDYNICQAYNKGKSMCNFDIICFVHEDVEFHSKDWGKVLVKTLADPSVGLVGVLGSCFLSLFPPDWVDPDEVEGQIIEGYKPNAPLLTFRRFDTIDIAEVAAVDGVFMTARKDVLNSIKFSDDILNGFHGYDFDLSMQIRENYKVVVTRNILLKHMSKGNFNPSYFEAVEQLEKKWKRKLPVYVSNYNKKELRNLKLKSLQKFWTDSKAESSKWKRHIKSFRYSAKNKVLFSWIFKTINNKWQNLQS